MPLRHSIWSRHSPDERKTVELDDLQFEDVPKAKIGMADIACERSQPECGDAIDVHPVRAAIISAARSAMAITGMLVLALVTAGITEASTTLRPLRP